MPKTVRVSLRSVLPDGTPFTGAVRFKPSSNALAPDKTFIASAAVYAHLSGEQHVDLIPCSEFGPGAYYTYELIKIERREERTIQRGKCVVPDHDCQFADITDIEIGLPIDKVLAELYAAEAKAARAEAVSAKEQAVLSAASAEASAASAATDAAEIKADLDTANSFLESVRDEVASAVVDITDAKADLSDEKAHALAHIQAEKKSALDAVSAVESTAIEDVNRVKGQAVDEVTRRGNEVLTKAEGIAEDADRTAQAIEGAFQKVESSAREVHEDVENLLQSRYLDHAENITRFATLANNFNRHLLDVAGGLIDA